MYLSIFAGHVATIMTQEAPCKFTLSPTPKVLANVEITPSKCGQKVWDQVTINGKWCGNRHGGIQEFARLVSQAKPALYD